VNGCAATPRATSTCGQIFTVSVVKAVPLLVPKIGGPVRIGVADVVGAVARTDGTPGEL
jgi:hypothetical protein